MPRTQVGGWNAVSPNKIEILKESTYVGGTSTNKVMEIEGSVGGAEVYRDFATYKGEMFTLSLSYSPRAGHLTGTDSAIDIYWEGTKVGTLNATTVGLKTYTFNFNATSATGTSRLQFRSINSDSYGGIIDNVNLTGTGFVKGSALPFKVTAALADTDGSETLGLSVPGIPVGSVLTDGTNRFTATAGNTSTAITTWNLNSLSIQPLATATTAFTLNIVATATETTNGATASTTTPFVVNVPGILVSPIVLDLNGDGIHTTSLSISTGKFDLLNNGNAINSGWISPDDGFLAIDTNGNGIIDNRSELFGGAIGEGFAKLADFDSNHDGKVDSHNARYAELEVWQDVNGNHQTDAGELKTLLQAGVKSLDVAYSMVPEQQNGNLLLERSHATLTNGRSIEMVDAYFQIEPIVDEHATSGTTSKVQNDYTKPMDHRSASISLMPTVPPTNNKGKPSTWRGFGTAPVFNASVLSNHPIPLKHNGIDAPVLDWTSSTDSNPINGADDPNKRKNRNNWIADFLGAGENSEDLVKQTGLKVTVGRLAIL